MRFFGKEFKRYASFLTNGEISLKIICNRYNCGVEVPEGVILSYDHKGSTYLNNKPAWIEVRAENAYEWI